MLAIERIGCKQLILVSTALLLGSLLIGNSVTNVSAEQSNVDTKAFYLFMRPRLGYFHRFPTSSPYAKVYEEYFANVIQKNDDALKDIPADDWRHFRPNAELCIDFLIGLQVKDYILSKPFDIVPLDACLDWLFDASSEKKLDEDRMSPDQMQELHLLTDDKELQRIFNETQFRAADKRVPERIQELIYNYIRNLLKIYSDNPRNGCHSLWLEAYNEFVENILLIDCEQDDESECKHFGYNGGAEDSYLTMIANSTVASAQSCYKVMQKQIHGLMDDEYVESNSGPTSFAKRFKSSRNRAAKQSEAKRWPREMMGILQLVSGVDPEHSINLGQCVVDLDKIKQNEKNTTKRFTRELAKYALENVDISKSENDPNGRARYGRAVTKLCRPYTDPKLFLSKTGGVYTKTNENEEEERKPFEFYHIIYSLVRLTNHEPIFKITKEQFEEDVLKYQWEALYLATFACQIISVTWGTLSHDSNQADFEVNLRPGASKIIDDWPINVMTQKLPLLYPLDSKSESKLMLPQAALFGRKYKLFGSNKSNKAEAAAAAAATEEPAALESYQAPPPAPLNPAVPPSYLAAPSQSSDVLQATQEFQQTPLHQLATVGGTANSMVETAQPRLHPLLRFAMRQPEQANKQNLPMSANFSPLNMLHLTSPPSSPQHKQQGGERSPFSQNENHGGKFTNKFMNLFKSNKQQAQSEAQTPVDQQQQQSSAPAMSAETIEMFKKLHGRYPQLSAQQKQAHPELPEDISGTFPKELGDRPLFADKSVVKSSSSPYNSREWLNSGKSEKRDERRSSREEREENDNSSEGRSSRKTKSDKSDKREKRGKRSKSKVRPEEPADELAF